MKVATTKLLTVLLVLFATVSVSAQFKVHFAANGNSNFSDQWHHILSGRGPAVNIVTQAPTERFFELLILIGSDSADVDFEGQLTMYTPDGKVYHKTEEFFPVLKGAVTPNNLILSPNKIIVCFDPGDAEGEYKLSLAIRDRKTQETKIEEIKVTHTGLSDFDTPKMNAEELLLFMNYYYKNPAPDKLLAAWRAFIAEMVPEMQKKKNFNPTPILYFFICALQDNKFVWEAFVNEAIKSGDNGALLAGIVIAAIPDLAAKARAKEFIVPILPPHMFTTFPITNANQQDMLWSKFFATGKFEPIAQLLSSTVPDGEAITVGAYKALKNPTSSDKHALMRFVISQSGIWSLSSNARQHALVFYYLECMVKRDTPASPEQLTILNDILEAAKVQTPDQTKSGNTPKAH